MKKFLYIAICAFVAASLCSCQKHLTTEGVTGITYYATITLDGDATIVHQKGTEFKDPGYSAVLNGQDVTSSVKVTSNVDTKKSGVYSVSYACTNDDGFTSSAKRTVIVLDLQDPIEGFYMTDPDSYRLNAAGAKTVYGASYEILVTSNGDGTYSCDDMLGGYYCVRAGYGSAYAMAAVFSINADNSLTLLQSAVPGWGDAADGLEGSYIPDGSTFSFCTDYAGMLFYINMTKE